MKSQEEEIDVLHHRLIRNLNSSIGKFISLNNVNKQLDEVVIKYVETLRNSINEVEEALDDLHKNAIWDNLVVAFFGITNAGKSTIIETLRARFDTSRKANSDGLIVGTGESDFTKFCQEYKLSIDDRSFILIDVPGIEGKEVEFKEEITKALKKAHCVFFINGENKKPDAAVASKIQTYLADWVNVYSIYNIRGGSSNYDEECERQDLLTENSVKIGGEIEETLRSALGDIYKGNISIQGLIALASVASFHPNLQHTLGKSQRNLMEYFGSKEAMYNFSRFCEVEHLIADKSKNFTQEIAEANKRKLIGLTKKAFCDLQNNVNNESRNIDLYKASIEKFEKDISLIFNYAKSQIKQQLKDCYDNMYDDIRTQLYDLIEENELNQERAEVIMNAAYDNFLYSCQDEINHIVKNMNSRIRKAKKEMRGWNGGVRSVIVSDMLNIEMAMDEAMGKMEISLKDIGSFVLDVGSTALVGAWFGPWGAVAGAFIGAIKHLLFSDGGKGKARLEIEKSLEDSKGKNKYMLDQIIQKITNQVDREKNNIVNQIRREKSNLLELSEIVGKTQIFLRSYINQLKY